MFKPEKTDDGFDGRRNNYIEYTSEGDDYNNLSPEEYLDIIRPYLKDLINNHSQSGEWKTQLLILNRRISSKNFEETCFVYSASNNIEIFRGRDTDEVIDKLFDALLQIFQEAKETLFEKGSKFIFENVDLLHYYFHRIDMRRGGSYIKLPEWINNKGATINTKNMNDDYCLQYAVPAALDHKDIGRDPQRILKLNLLIKPWEGIELKFEQNNETIALDILYVSNNTKEISRAYKSKYNNERENQVILLMIKDGKRSKGVEESHYLALKSEPVLYNGKLYNRPVKSLSRLLKGISSNHKEDFNCLKCFNSYSTEHRLKEHEEICNKSDSCCIIMPW